MKERNRFSLPDSFSIPVNAITVGDGKLVRVRDVAERNLANQRRIEQSPKVSHSVYERMKK